MATPPVFSAGAVLTAAQMNAVGLWKIKSVSLATGTTDITSCFSSDFNAYRIVFTSLAPTVDDVLIRGQMLSGTTPLTTNTYETQRLYAHNTTVGATGTNGTPIGYGNIGYCSSAGDGGGAGAVMDIFNPYTANYTSWFSEVSYVYAFQEHHSAVVKNTTSYDGIRISVASGNLTGTAVVYGYRI